MIRLRLATIAALAVALPSVSAVAQDAADFFRGRHITLIVGTGPGGGYDSYGRLFAQHFSRHLPGEPRVIVQNMPGASGITATNYLYSLAEKTGSVIGTVNQSIALRQLMREPAVRFDAAKLNWLGAMSSSVTVFIVWKDAGIVTLEDAKRKEVTMGATGAAGGNAIFPRIVNSQLGTRFKPVTGYQAGADILLAMERREVDGMGSMNWTALKAGWPQWFTDKSFNTVLQIGLTRDPDLPNVPLLIDLAGNETQKALFHLISADTIMGWPIVAPPDVPADRLALLRKAFSDTMADPVLLADADKRKMEIINPSSGDAVQAVVRSVLATPPDVVAIFTEMSKPEGK